MNKVILGAIAAVFIVMPASIILIPHGSECCEYNWEYDGRSYSMKYDCDPQLLDEYREQIHDRIPLGSYEKKGKLFRKYIAESVTEKYLTDLVERLRGIYNDGDDLDLFIRSFVIENFDYCPDYINYGIFDWIAYPCETMEKGSGDCEDLGILLLSLLKAAGYDCGFVLFDDHFFQLPPVLPQITLLMTVYRNSASL